MKKTCPKGSIAKMGEKNPMWNKIKREAKYCAIHEYVRRRLSKPTMCEHCGLEKALDMANKSGKYKRDLSDWMWLCRRCHMNYDGNDKWLELGRGMNKGKKFSTEWRKRLSESHKGQTPWNKGKKGLQKAWNKGLKIK